VVKVVRETAWLPDATIVDAVTCFSVGHFNVGSILIDGHARLLPVTFIYRSSHAKKISPLRGIQNNSKLVVSLLIRYLPTSSGGAPQPASPTPRHPFIGPHSQRANLAPSPSRARKRENLLLSQSTTPHDPHSVA